MITNGAGGLPRPIILSGGKDVYRQPDLASPWRMLSCLSVVIYYPVIPSSRHQPGHESPVTEPAIIVGRRMTDHAWWCVTSMERQDARGFIDNNVCGMPPEARCAQLAIMIHGSSLTVRPQVFTMCSRHICVKWQLVSLCEALLSWVSSWRAMNHQSVSRSNVL